MQIRHRHHIRPQDTFVMRPGYTNLQGIECGELLASDQDGDIRAPFAGRVFLPLYQSQGDDGFFIVQELQSTDSG